jgi:hypothetical protein
MLIERKVKEVEEEEIPLFFTITEPMDELKPVCFHNGESEVKSYEDINNEKFFMNLEEEIIHVEKEIPLIFILNKKHKKIDVYYYSLIKLEERSEIKIKFEDVKQNTPIIEKISIIKNEFHFNIKMDDRKRYEDDDEMDNNITSEENEIINRTKDENINLFESELFCKLINIQSKMLKNIDLNTYENNYVFHVYDDFFDDNKKNLIIYDKINQMIQNYSIYFEKGKLIYHLINEMNDIQDVIIIRGLFNKNMILLLINNNIMLYTGKYKIIGFEFSEKFIIKKFEFCFLTNLIFHTSEKTLKSDLNINFSNELNSIFEIFYKNLSNDLFINILNDFFEQFYLYYSNEFIAFIDIFKNLQSFKFYNFDDGFFFFFKN